ncbi:MAG: type II toxin-antitoxin system HicB family antitoxin [Acidobacteria bacterium]|nr:type II toxin-antitoxin system HicB family antitoxin [Acidobacteriota bacterium]
MVLSYPVKLTAEGDHVLVDFPDLPEAHTWGEDRDEALARAVDALTTIVGACMRDGQPVPRPSRRRGPTVPLPPLAGAKVELYNAMVEQGVNRAELGRRLNWERPRVDRALDVLHISRIDEIEHALAAVGKRIELRVV